MQKLLKQLPVVLFFFACLISCKKDKNNGPGNIPNQTVDIYIYPNDPQWATTIGVPGGWVYITGGVRGIILYRKNTTDFAAYERTCTYDANTGVALKVQSDNVTIRDSVCNSKFLILDGGVTQGPAAQSLKTYGTTFDGTVLHIYN
jgi:hypothetical protein